MLKVLAAEIVKLLSNRDNYLCLATETSADHIDSQVKHPYGLCDFKRFQNFLSCQYRSKIVKESPAIHHYSPQACPLLWRLPAKSHSAFDRYCTSVASFELFSTEKDNDMWHQMQVSGEVPIVKSFKLLHWMLVYEVLLYCKLCNHMIAHPAMQKTMEKVKHEGNCY